MKKIYIFLAIVLVLIIGFLFLVKQNQKNIIQDNKEIVALGEVDDSDIQWKLTAESNLADVSTPVSKVVLNIKNMKNYVIGKYNGSCTKADGTNWDKNQISGLVCRWAKRSDELRVVSEDGKYIMKHRVVEEGQDAEKAQFRTIMKLD